MVTKYILYYHFYDRVFVKIKRKECGFLLYATKEKG